MLKIILVNGNVRPCGAGRRRVFGFLGLGRRLRRCAPWFVVETIPLPVNTRVPRPSIDHSNDAMVYAIRACLDWNLSTLMMAD